MAEESTDFPGPYEAFQVEYVKEDHPGIVADVRRVADGQTGTLTAAGDERFEFRSEGPGAGGPDNLPKLLASEEVNRVFEENGGTYTIGQVINILN